MTSIPCTHCGWEWQTKSAAKAPQPFICKACRCADCQIVIGFECPCEETHGRRSALEPSICEDCVAIRARVAGALDERELRLRAADMTAEDKLWESQ